MPKNHIIPPPGPVLISIPSGAHTARVMLFI